MGHHGHHPGRPPPRRARRSGGAGRLDGRQEGQAVPERRVRQRPRVLRARHEPRLPQGQVPAGRTEKLGRLLGRQEVSRQSLDAQQRGAHGELPWELLQSAIQPTPQAALANKLVYVPTNPEASKYISPEVSRQLPTYPENVKVAIKPDTVAEADQTAKIQERFTQWLAS